MKSLQEITASRPLADLKKNSSEYSYSSWNEFLHYSPWQNFFNLELCDYMWSSAGILFLFYNCAKNPNDRRHFAVTIQDSEETLVRDWIRDHTPIIWKI